MRNYSLIGNIGAMLHRCKQLETSMRQAGMPAFLACLPLGVLALQYCFMLRQKTSRIVRIAGRIERWQGTVDQLSAHEKGRSEFIDLDRKMRIDIEAAATSMRGLRELCMEICAMFTAIGYQSPMLESALQRFFNAVENACEASARLVEKVDAHDRRALSIRQQQHALEQAAQASSIAHGARR